MTDKALAQLINTINNGTHQLPGLLNTMIEQYAISNYVTATIYFLLSIGGVMTVIKLHKITDFESGDDGAFLMNMSLIILGISSLLLFMAGIEHLNNALNPIYSLINDLR